MPKTSPFPPHDLNEALVIAKTIWEQNSGKPMRRLTIFGALNRSPESGTSRSLLTASSGYGLTRGGYKAELIELTERGTVIAERDDPQAKLDAVLGVRPFAKFFENYRNAALPSSAAGLDFLRKQGLSDQAAAVCHEVLVKSGEQVALIQEISGVKRVVSPEHALEVLASPGRAIARPTPPSPHPPEGAQAAIQPEAADSVQQLPSLHIDIQIHIGGDAKPEQIEKVFESMAKHLYRKGQK